MLGFRVLASIVCLVSVLLLGYGYWLQFVEHLEPCPLCIFQRVAFMALAGTGLIAALHNPSTLGRYVYALFGVFFSLSGGLIAARHVWLQSLPPDRVPECGPGLDYLIEVFSFPDMLGKVFTGSGECAAVDWSFFYLSMPAWALIWFVLLGAIFAFAGLRR